MIKTLSAENYTIRPFIVNKSYSFSYNTTGSVANNTNGIFVYKGDSPNIYNTFYPYPPPVLDGNSVQEPVNINGSTVISSMAFYDSVNNSFYNIDKSKYQLLGSFDDSRESLGDLIYVISISKNLYGEKLSPGSIYIKDKNFTYYDSGSSSYISLIFRDDEYGNLYEQSTLQQVGNVFYESGLIVFNRISSITTVSSSLALTNTWVTFSSGSQDLPNGVYAVQIQTNSGGTVDQQYSGIFNWYTGLGAANANSEVVLQRGKSPAAIASDIIYFRIKNTAGSLPEMQVSTDGPTTPSTKEYHFTFLRLL